MGTSSMNYDNATLPNNGYDFKVKQYTFKAVCLSEKCNEIRQDGIAKTRSVKNVSKTEIDCPDCGHILTWERKELERNRV